MLFLKRFAQGELRLGRIEAFSDGVFAIIVTLLVLDLRVPELHEPISTSDLGEQLILLLPKFLSWLISFVIVCKFWLNHHYALGLARHANYGMVWLNSIFLMFQSFVPFPTALMGEYPTNPLAVSLFGIVMSFNTVLFIVLQSYIIRNLLKPELVEEIDPRLTRKSLSGPAGYLLGAALAWFSVHAAFLFYILTPLLFITPPSRPKAEISHPG
ncbi:MAG: DUF1211 domain-containing protein [Methylacidiphilales bacterium]|nr:DUF1211 domain-containing protein [Candidatus Methylacidiphilales bacterium]